MKPQANRKLQRLLTLLLGGAVVLVSAWLTNQQVWRADWTAGNRNTLTPASQRLLEAMPEPIEFTAWVIPNAELKREIEARIGPYLRARSNISLSFVDPAMQPEAARELGVAASGEIVIDYQGRRENLSAISESSISGALQRLAYAGQARILLLGGHGERDAGDSGQAGYSDFVAALGAKGLAVEPFTFAEQPEVPGSADVLVLAAPRRALLDAEIDRILDYIQAGGKLLWLFDPDSQPIPRLAQALSIEQLNGTVIYQDYELLGTGHPALALVADYSGHAISKQFADLTLYPVAGGIRLVPGGSWIGNRLMSSPRRSWLETGPLDKNLVFEAASDTDGPVTIGVALSRFGQSGQAAAEQRAVVIADSDFLSNGFVQQLGNRQLGFNILQWLASRDAQIDIDVPAAPDMTLQLSPLATMLMASLFVVLLPLTLLMLGLIRWWYRRARHQ